MSDTQKALAVLNAVMDAGGRVRGEYARWLETTPGQVDQLRAEVDQLTKSVAGGLSPALTDVVGGLRTTVQFVSNHGPLVTGLVTATGAAFGLAKGLQAVAAAETALQAAGGLRGAARLAGGALGSVGGLSIGGLAAGGAIGAGILAYGVAKADEKSNPAAIAAAARRMPTADLQRQIAERRQVVENLRALNKDAAVIAAAQARLDAVLGVLATRRTVAVLPTITVGADAPKAVNALKVARAQFHALEDQVQAIARLQTVAADGFTVPGLDTRAVVVYDRVTAALGRQRNQFSETAAKLRDYQRDLLGVQAVALLRAPETLAAQFAVRVAPTVTPSAPSTLPNLRAVVSPVQIAAPQLTKFERATTAASNQLAFLREAAEVSADALRDAPAGLRTFFDTLRRTAGAGETIADAVRRPRDLLARRPSGATDVLGTIGNVVGVVGAVTSVVGLVGGLFGKSPAEQERAQLLKQNNERLAALRDELSGTLRSGAGLTSVRTALTAGGLERSAANGGFSGLFGGSHLTINQDALRRAGLTQDQLVSVAKAQGIELLDSKGRLVAGALGQLQTALGLTAEQLTRFGVSVDSQRTRESLRQQLFSPGTAGTPQATVGIELGLLQKLAPALGGRFQGLTGDTAASREAIRQGLQQLFTQIDTNQLQLGDLGQLASLDELVGIIRSTNDALTQMGSAATGVAAALLNVPTGYKVALARFDAQDALTPALPGLPAGVPPVPGLTLPSVPRAPTARPGGPGERTPTDGYGAAVFTGDIHITPAAGETTDEAFERIVAGKKRLARSRGLNPLEWARVA